MKKWVGSAVFAVMMICFLPVMVFALPVPDTGQPRTHITAFSEQLESQNLLPLHVDNRSIKDSADNIISLKSINFNHHMEYPYDESSPEYFHNSLIWLHSSEDYQHIKAWGLNCVRLNISYAHIDDDIAFKNLIDQVQYAKQAGVYIIIAYFAPPGSLFRDGYYDEKPFFDDIRQSDGALNPDSQYFKKYLEQWQRISDEFKNETNVLYELLNEPQLLNDWEDYGDNDQARVKNETSLSPATKDEILYIQLMQQIITTIRTSGDNNIIMIDGLCYADVKPNYYRFISELNQNSNIVYSFHYYHPQDFVDQQCNWQGGIYSFYQNKYKDLITQEPGWTDSSTKVEFDFGAVNDICPKVQINSVNQSGDYYLKNIEIWDLTDNKLVFSDNFKTKTKNNNVNVGDSDVCEGKLNDIDPTKEWATLSNNQWGSSVNSKIDLLSIDGESVVSIENSINKDQTKNIYGFITCIGSVIPDMLKEGTWAGLYRYDYSTYQNNFQLEKDKNYKFSLILKGRHLTTYGQLSISFIEPGNPEKPFLTKWVRRYHLIDATGNPVNIDNNNEVKQLSSDLDMMGADFDMLKNLSERYNVPFYVGEFAVPERNLNPNDSIKYFQILTKYCEDRGFGWALFVYREPFSSDYGELRTFGLYSGEGKTVSEMESLGFGTDINISQYFYRKDFIDVLRLTQPLISVVQKLFIGYYLRPAAPAGLLFWAEKWAEEEAKPDGSIKNVIEAFANTPESQAIWEGDITEDTIDTFINKVFQALFGRNAAPYGLNFYHTGFTNGTFTPGTIVYDIFVGAPEGSHDKAVLDKKLAFANAFTGILEQNPDDNPLNDQAAYKGQTDAAVARDMLAAVGETTVIDPAAIAEQIKDQIADPGDPILN